MPKKDYGETTGLRLSAALTGEAKTASEKLDISKQDAMRFAMAIGFEQLKMIDYKVAKAVLDAALKDGRKKKQDAVSAAR